MTYTPSDFGLDKNGPQFAWLDQRLTLHGHTPTRLTMNLKDRVRTFQLAQGWTGTGADGLVGPKTLARLTADPIAPATGIDLSIWKWTSPDGEPEHPTEVHPLPQDFTRPPHFINNGPAGITFRTPVDGVTTSGSGYPRSELREMTKAGDKAKWSSRNGTHRMRGRCRVTELPDGKDEVVIGQIHDPYDDVVMVLVSGPDIFLSESKYPDSGSNRRLIGMDYRLGDPIDLDITATPTGIKTTVNGRSLTTYKTVVDAYFKAGCYSQANESNGSGAAEVEYETLEVEHS